MKINLRFSFIILLLTFHFPFLELLAKKYRYVTTPVAKLLPKPNLSSKGNRLKRGDKLEILFQQGMFYKVRLKNKTGYIAKMFTSPNKPGSGVKWTFSGPTTEKENKRMRYCSSEKRSDEFYASIKKSNRNKNLTQKKSPAIQQKKNKGKPLNQERKISTLKVRKTTFSYKNILGIGVFENTGFNLKPKTKFLQLNLFSGNSASVNGLNPGLYKNIITGDLKGFQLGLFNSVEKSSYGLQVGMFNDVVKGGGGLQLGFLGNRNSKDGFWGAQVSTLSNWAKDSFSFAQLSFLKNKAKYSIIQTSVFYNHSDNSFLQVSTINGSKEMNFIQAGFFNGSAKSKLMQLGLFNFSEKPSLQIGLVNGSGISIIQFGLLNSNNRKSFIQLGLLNYSKNSPIPFLPFLNINPNALND